MYEESILAEVNARENCTDEIYLLEFGFEDEVEIIKNKNKRELL